jgi:hypothetical protein
MQGILMSHFQQVKKFLSELQQVELFDLPCTHLNNIVEHEQRHAEIYQKYKTALFNVETLIKEFDVHKKSVRRLIIEHKRCKKLIRIPAPLLTDSK